MCPLYLKKKTTLPPTLHHHSLWIIHLNRKTQISDFCHPSFKSGSRSITSKNSARDNMRSPSMSRVPWIQGGCTLKMLWVQRALNYSKKKQKFINQTWMMTLQKCMSLYVYIYIYILMYIRMYVICIYLISDTSNAVVVPGNHAMKQHDETKKILAAWTLKYNLPSCAHWYWWGYMK